MNSAAIFQTISHSLNHKTQTVRDRVQKKHPHTYHLLQKKNLLPGQLRLFATKLITTTTMTGHILAHAGGMFSLVAGQIIHASPPQQVTSLQDIDYQQQVITFLKPISASDPGKINQAQIDALNTHLQSAFNLTAAAKLEGNQLNHQIGWIGFEQHLIRYPGDSLSQHDELQEAGLAPGLGAWGYFANSKSQLTPTDILREKYYVAVQTLYLDDWNSDHQKLKDWYKYRKVIVINPQNGHAIIANIADAGPAKWTGKQFGGSPEVMQHLNLHLGPRNGKAILLFVDDPDDKIPLGPLTYNQ